MSLSTRASQQITTTHASCQGHSVLGASLPPSLADHVAAWELLPNHDQIGLIWNAHRSCYLILSLMVSIFKSVRFDPSSLRAASAFNVVHGKWISITAPHFLHESNVKARGPFVSHYKTLTILMLTLCYNKAGSEQLQTCAAFCLLPVSLSVTPVPPPPLQ